MTPLALLIRAQESLPPPPEPTGSPQIDTARVVGVVIVSLGIIVLLALAIRPLVVKPRRPDQGDEPAPQPDLPEPADMPPGTGSIIPFPRQFTVEAAGQGPARPEGTSIPERFNRVVGDQAQRRKLGDRQPVRPTHDLAAAALNRVATDASVAPVRPTPKAPVTPIHGAARPTNRRAPAARSGESAVGGDDRPVTSRPLAGAASASDTETNQTATVEAPTGRTDMPDTLASTDFAQRARPKASSHEPSFGPAERQSSESTVPAGDAPAQPDHEEIDILTLAALHQVVRDLIHCANTGELLHGFALYSDPFLFRFMDGSGLTEDEFRKFYESVAARPRDAWDHLDRLFDVVRLPDGRIEATASYVDGSGAPSNGLERYRFVEVDGVWMIDDISPVDSPN